MQNFLPSFHPSLPNFNFLSLLCSCCLSLSGSPVCLCLLITKFRFQYFVSGRLIFILIKWIASENLYLNKCEHNQLLMDALCLISSRYRRLCNSALSDPTHHVIDTLILLLIKRNFVFNLYRMQASLAGLVTRFLKFSFMLWTSSIP